MKRTVSLVLAAALVLGSIPAGFAASAGETLKGYGVVAGDTNGSLNEDKTITRAEMMTVLARLLGKYEEASKYSIPSTSKDVAGHWNAKVIAFAEKEGWTAGKGNGMFDPQGVVTLQETAAFMLKALGYTITDYAKVVEEATAKGLLKDVVAKELNAPVKRSDVFASALNTLNTPAKDATVKLGEKLGYFKSEALAVGEIKANAANSFQVKFNKAVDPTKVAFAVKRENTATTVTTTWNTEKTLATLTYASKLPEGNYEVTVNDTTTADKPVVMATQKVVIEKEKIAKVEIASETLLRYNDRQGYVPYKVLNQYNEDVTNTTLGRSLTEVQTLGGNGTVTLKRDAGIAIFTYYVDTNNMLRNLPSVVFTIQDTTAGFVFTKTLKVSDTANAIAEVKINGIVNEKGEKVDFVWSRTKAYYLDITVLDANGQEIKSLDVLKATDNNVPVLQVRASDSTNINLTNGYVVVSDAPGKTNVGAWRLAIQSATSPEYDTPVTFTAIAPFGTTGKNNATFTTTLKRAAKVEKFTMLSPAEIATPNRDVEFFFEAFNQNGEKVTAYDDLAGRVTFSAGTGTVKFVRQADGSAKLIGNFPTKQLYYVTATVTGSLTGSFSQVAVDVKEASNDARLSALAHARLYTPNAGWTVASDKFTIKDKYDRALNLKTDSEANDYSVKVIVPNNDIINLTAVKGTTVQSDANNKWVIVRGGDEFKFVGGATAGTSVVSYELYKAGTATPISTASAVAYNISTKDVKSIVLAPSADPTYMTSKDTTGKFFTGGANTDLGTEQYRDLGVYGKTKDGAEVRLNTADTSIFTTKTTNQSFSTGTKFRANGEFPSTATTATTVASAQYNNGSDVLTATATVNASADKPVASTVTVESDAAARRAGTIKLNSNVLTVTAAQFNAQFVGKSMYSYNKATGASVANQTAVYFNAESQYGDYVVDKVDVIKNNVGGGTFSVDSTTGVITGSVQANDQFTITASTENGKKAVITVIIEGEGNAAATNLAAAEAAVAAYEAMPRLTPANVDALIADGGAAAQVAVNKVADAAARAGLQARLVTANNATQVFVAAITNVTTKAGLGTADANDYLAIKITVAAADLATVNTAVAAAAPTAKDTAVEIKTIADAAVAAAGTDAAAKLAAAQTAVATVESYRDLAVTTSTKANIDAFVSAYNTAATKIAAAPAANQAALTTQIDNAKTAVAAVVTFSVVKVNATSVKYVINGTDVVTGLDAAGFGKVTTPTNANPGATLSIASNGTVSVSANAAADNTTASFSTVVTYTFFNKAATAIVTNVVDVAGTETLTVQ